MLLAILLFIGSGCALQAQTKVVFEGKNPISNNEGYTALKWHPVGTPSEGTQYELQQSRSEDFSDAVTLYKGPDMASFVSGLPEGKTWYRVRAAGGPWSPAQVVEINFIETYKVVAGLAVGTAMLIFTIIYVVVSHQRTKNASIV